VEGDQKEQPSKVDHKQSNQKADIKKAMTAMEYINLTLPEHDRDSCSDDDIGNGFYSRTGDSWYGRCQRCMALQIIRGEEEIPEDFDSDYFNG
jgi:hypothetical protein